MNLKKLGAAAVIFNEKGNVLLVKHSYGRLNWELPGGCAEPGESVIETALREVREETSLEVVAERTSGIYFDAEEDFHHFVFLCHAPDGQLRFEPNHEITECAYWPRTALPRPISDFTMRRIEDAATGKPLILPVTFRGRTWLEQID